MPPDQAAAASPPAAADPHEQQQQQQQQQQQPKAYFHPHVAAAAREAVPLDAARTAVLFVDVQRYNLHPQGAVWRDLLLAASGKGDQAAAADASAAAERHFARVASCVPRWRLLLETARLSGAEPLFTVIQSLTQDGRDRGLDYKLSGMHVPPGSEDARVLEEVAPGRDEIVLPKSSSSPFASTSLEYLLRSLGRDQILVCGALTDQCVSSTVREACDRGLRVTLARDACVGSSAARHAEAIDHIKGYCRVRTSAECAAELMMGSRVEAKEGRRLEAKEGGEG
jgi:ureidoacrylate peracid hydrolase